MKKTTNLTAFLEIFLYLKNNNSVENVWKSFVYCAIHLFPFYYLEWNHYFSACKSLSNYSCHFWIHKSVLHQFSVPSNRTPLYFFASNIIYFGQKQPTKEQVFEIFECSGQNSLNSSCQFWNKRSIPTLGHFLLWIKGSRQSPNFKAFKCPGKKLPNFLCHFPYHKVSFSSNFASFFSITSHNFSALF